jgi:glycosyltransferase involved in cell wall biosynthesis
MNGGAAADPATSGPLHLVTCEYPPDIGGVADHSRALAAALAAAGMRVHVWCPPAVGAPATGRGFEVHVLPDRFGPRSLRALALALDEQPPPRRLFVQWVPHGYCRRSLNLPFCAWIWRRARRHGDRIDVMVHEAYLAFHPRRLRQSAAAALHRVMLATLLHAASRVWLATPSFERYVRPYALGRRVPFGWLPLPSPLDVTTDADLVARVRTAHRSPLVGHFGTFGPLVTAMLTPVIDRTLRARPDVSWLLIGRDGDRFAREFAGRDPQLAERLTSTGTLPAPALSAHLLACDVFVQPYPDGVTARRTTATALLAHRRAIVTTEGHLTEPFWRSDGGVRLARAGDTPGLAAGLLDVLDDLPARERLGAAAGAMFTRRFSTETVVAAVRGDR